jgi:hypothetical protein
MSVILRGMVNHMKAKRKPNGVMSKIAELRRGTRDNRSAVKLLKCFPKLGGIGYCYLFTWSKTIRIDPDGCSAFELAKDIRQHLKPLYAGSGIPTSMRVIRKHLDESTGTMKWKFIHPLDKEWTISIEGDDPKCKLRKVEKVVHHPAQAAYSDTQTRFVVDNPDECWGHKPKV